MQTHSYYAAACDKISVLYPAAQKWVRGRYFAVRDWFNEIYGNGAERAFCIPFISLGVATLLFAATNGADNYFNIARHSLYSGVLLSMFYAAQVAINHRFPNDQDEDHTFVWNAAELFTSIVLQIPIVWGVAVFCQDQIRSYLGA